MNMSEPLHGLFQAKQRVLEIQTKLHRWANDDPHRRFDDLFNLVTDPTEQVNLAAKDPARVTELRKLIEAQNAGLPKPLWPGILEGAIRIDVPLNAPWKKDQEYVYWAN